MLFQVIAMYIFVYGTLKVNLKFLPIMFGLHILRLHLSRVLGENLILKIPKRNHFFQTGQPNHGWWGNGELGLNELVVTIILSTKIIIKFVFVVTLHVYILNSLC